MSHLRLSEAIREGAKLRPQAYGTFFVCDDRYGLRSCALGAAVEAATGRANGSHLALNGINEELLDLFGSTLVTPAVCPECKTEVRRAGADEYFSSNVFVVVSHLNDNHVYSRERIADWVATIESEIV